MPSFRPKITLQVAFVTVLSFGSLVFAPIPAAEAVDPTPTISQPLTGVGFPSDNAISWDLQEVYWDDWVTFTTQNFCRSQALGPLVDMLIKEVGPNRDRYTGFWAGAYQSDTPVASLSTSLHGKGDYGFEFVQYCGASADFPQGINFPVGFVRLHVDNPPQVSATSSISYVTHDNSIVVSVAPVEHALGYEVRVTDVATGNSVRGCIAELGSTTCTVTGLTTGNKYVLSVNTWAHGRMYDAVASQPTGQIVAAEPIYAQATVASTWHVGDMVTATGYYSGGNATNMEYFWYRCNSAVPETVAEPTGCSLISTGTQNTYTLTNLDLGKYVSAMVKASNAWVFGTKTAYNGQVTLAAPTPLQVSGTLTSNWKVGDVVTFSPMVTGVPSHTDIQWYRCDTSVAALNAQPNCQIILGETSYTYELAAADLGKYVTAFIHVINPVSDVMKTFANSRVTLAGTTPTPSPTSSSTTSPTPTPTPTDDGRPRVNPSPSLDVPLSGGATIVISGTNLGTVTTVTVNGVVARIVSSTDKSIVIEIPSSTKPGVADIVISSSKGSVTSPSALNYVGETSVKVPPKSLTIKGFSAKSYVLTTTMKSQIKAFVMANPGFETAICVGDSSGLKKAATELSLALARAKSACAYAKSLSTKLKATAVGRQTNSVGVLARFVALTLSK